MKEQFQVAELEVTFGVNDMGVNILREDEEI